MTKRPKRKTKTEWKTYAWNFRIVADGLLVLRAISQDSIGVIKVDSAGGFAFWSLGNVTRCRTLAELVAIIDKVEAAT